MSCGICNVDSECYSRFISCGVCTSTFHANCVNPKIRGNCIDAILAADSGIRWFCVNCRRLSSANLFAKLCKFEKTFKSLSESLSDVNDMFKNHACDYAELKNLVEASVDAGNPGKCKTKRRNVQSKRQGIPPIAPTSPVATWSLFDTICDVYSSVNTFKYAVENAHILQVMDSCDRPAVNDFKNMSITAVSPSIAVCSAALEQAVSNAITTMASSSPIAAANTSCNLELPPTFASTVAQSSSVIPATDNSKSSTVSILEAVVAPPNIIFYLGLNTEQRLKTLLITLKVMT